MMTIDTTNMCSHLQKKLFEEDGIYHHLWLAMQDDSELTAVVRSRQLHIYRNGKKVLVLAGKSAPKIIREDKHKFIFPLYDFTLFQLIVYFVRHSLLPFV